MKRLMCLLLPSVVVLGVIGIIFWSAPTIAGAPNSMTNADYIGTPPFITTIVTPNVLIILDNSGSMGYRAVCDNTTNGGTPYNACPTSPDIYPAGTPAGAPFIETVTFIGLFDTLSCYSYDATAGNTRFVVTTTKATINTACAATDWDGNFLNWATFRRQDAMKKALIGAQCAGTRQTDGSCPASGSPLLITMKGVDAQLGGLGPNDSTYPTPKGAGANNANGRIPTAVQSLVTSTGVVIHLIGSTSGGSLVPGGFCIGNSTSSPPSTSASTCGVTSVPTTPANGEFLIHMTVPFEPTGLIQDIGANGRFGLMEFRSTGSAQDGGKVLVPIGWNQATPYDLTSVTTYTSNQTAMIAGIEGTVAATATPLAETLYTGIRYFAQLPQPFSSTTYYYPCAFSGCGPIFPATTQAGSIGSITSPAAASEPSQLVSGDTCQTGPTGSGRDYLAGACGRDPYYFGSTQSWASPSAQVSCCSSFILLLTDGEALGDNNLPTSLQDYAHAAHGAHCAGNWAGPPAANPAANQYLTGVSGLNAIPSTCFNSDTDSIAPEVLLLKHKVDYETGSLTSPSLDHSVDDIAYWGHVTDLRPETTADQTAPSGACTTSPQGTPSGASLRGLSPAETGHPLCGFQNVTLYPIFAFGNIHGRELLMQAAKQGGFNDSDTKPTSCTPNPTCPGSGYNLPDKRSEWDSVDNVTGLAVPDGIPDTYFESKNANDIKGKLLQAFISILQKAASGTSISVLATSSTGEGAIYQAFFFPTTFVPLGTTTNVVTWTGFTQGLFIDKFGNIREDYSLSGCTGPPDGKLVLTHDCIIRVRVETDPTSPNFNSVVVDRFKDDGTAPGSTAGDGIADTTTPEPGNTVPLSNNGQNNVHPIWEGGRRLALTPPGDTCESSSTWPKAGSLTESGRNCRRILTWADLDNGGSVGGGSGTETLEFSTANVATLCPYLGGANVLTCTSAGAPGTTAITEATNIINWIRGCPGTTCNGTGLRDRTMNVVNDSNVIVQGQWKLGDIANANPVIVGAPTTRYDVIYGDATYASFFRRYKDRRQVAYVGANDGMLHAFNAGFFSNDDRAIDGTGPTVQVRYTTTPKKVGTSTDCAALPCDGNVTTYSFRSDAPPLGAELWAFIPQDLLPQLKFLTFRNYGHMYYVDLSPKVTDARIFTADADHPGGWGTILIGGFRLGGSCSLCASGKGTPRVVNADFSIPPNGTTTDTGNGTSGSDYRVFLSSYFVLDITNPEKEPTLLWVFRDDDLGMATADTAIVRVNPSGVASTNSTNERWFVVFGAGPTHFDGFSIQNAQFWAVDLKLGPAYSDINRTTGNKGHGKKKGLPCPFTLPCVSAFTNVSTGAVRVFDTGQAGAFMSDAVTVDYNFDFRVDAIYAGSVICNGTVTSTGCPGTGPVWRGAMWRLTTNGGDTDPDTWGITFGTGSNAAQGPTAVISTFAYTTSQASTCTNVSPCKVGPITSAPTLTQDDTHNLWIFFGTGRYFTSSDKANVDIQHFYGVKDAILTGGTSPTCSSQTSECNSLFNSSNVVTCSSCASGANVSTTSGTPSFTIGFSSGSGNLVNNIQNMDGWFTTFNDPTAPMQTPPRSAMTAGERNLSPATLLGGTVFFTTFIPSGDICHPTGSGQLYAVYYLTGGPYTGSAIGTVTSGGNTLVAKSLSLGQGLPTQMQIHVGAELPTNYAPPTPGDCAGSRVIGITQTSTGAAAVTCLKPARPFYSRMVSWRDL